MAVYTRPEKKTRLAFFLSGLLVEPLVGLTMVLPFILRKDLQAGGFQIAIFSMVKPVVALLSFYWGASLCRSQNKLKSNWMGASFLSCLPFLLFPFFNAVGFFILGAALFHFFQRGGVPAKMEILKQNFPQGMRENIFTLSSAINFLCGAGIGIVLSFWIDVGIGDWKNLFFWGGFLGLLSLVLQAGVPAPTGNQEAILPPTPKKLSRFLTPWKDSWRLLQERRDFAHFQIGFMLGGIGLMLIMPALILYAADDLKITHSQMILSRFVWMGLGFVIATPFWRRQISYEEIFRFTAKVNLVFAAAALVWFLASWHEVWFFVAFFLYGIAQAGSHLSWHLSAPLFAGSGPSTLFSTVNILTVGLRGLLIPWISPLLCSAMGTPAVLCMGALFCAVGAVCLHRFQFKRVPYV